MFYIKENIYPPMNRQKITWLQILQGWSMLLVVIGHVTLTGIFENPQTPVSATIERVIYSFHMPLFMFISGFLFYFTKISRDLAYKEVVFDKLKRLGIPYLFFTFFTFSVKFIFSPFMKRPVELSLRQFTDSFLYPGSNPLSEMWFVATLFIIMLSYPLLKYMITGNFKIAVLIIGSVVLNLFFPPDIFLLCLSNVAYMFLFFLLRHTFLQIRYTTFFESFRESPTFAPSFHRTESDSRLPDFTVKPHRNNLFRLIVSELNPDSIRTILLLPRLYVSNFSIRNFSANSHQNTLLQDSTKRIVLLESLYH